MTLCAFSAPGQGKCGAFPVKHGYCQRHLRDSPQEQEARSILDTKIAAAKHELEECGAEILRVYVASGHEGPIPEEVRREYRNLWYRRNYLWELRVQRRPGDELPAEVTMR